MIKIEKLVLGDLYTNVYLLVCDSGILVVDPAAEPNKIIAVAQEIGKPITHVLLTHGHFDHCNAAASLQKQGAKVLMSKTDYEMIQNGFDLAKYAGFTFNDFVPDEFVSEGECEIAGQSLKILDTPGHTAGSVTYVFGNDVFCGDTLFFMGVGRTDLPTGDGRKLCQSIQKLYKLTSGAVHPGHGKSTNIEFEKENNPYVKA
ncbi:MAG: MBL fold metallo-hydrolase [Clostridiales bacterium]|nr:MBL fold metallo-hydrolase [Clostridiales bacterium]